MSRKLAILKKKAVENKVIAKERIEELFKVAESLPKEELNLKNRYVELARQISMKFKVPIPSIYKRRFCKHCYTYLIPSVNSRTRVKDKLVITYCQSCKKYSKFGYRKSSVKK